MKQQPVIDLSNPPSGSIPATREQLHAIGVTDAEIEAGEKRLESEHIGPWHLCSSLRGIVEEQQWDDRHNVTVARFWPARTCSSPKSRGYAMEGRISLNGERRHVFTSSTLFELPDGWLVNVGTLHLCKR